MFGAPPLRGGGVLAPRIGGAGTGKAMKETCTDEQRHQTKSVTPVRLGVYRFEGGVRCSKQRPAPVSRGPGQVRSASRWVSLGWSHTPGYDLGGRDA